jgi:hypothetical protein
MRRESCVCASFEGKSKAAPKGKGRLRRSLALRMVVLAPLTSHEQRDLVTFIKYC